MIPIPAIDLKGGRVVRLSQGDFNKEKIYTDNAGAVAKAFEQDGAKRIHIVDLDGALKGEPQNRGPLEQILSSVKVPVELGGGIRSLKIAESYISMGVSWVVLGTKACLDHGFLKEAIAEFGPKVIVGIDALNGLVATDGWTKVTQNNALALAKLAEDFGAKTIIYTDISKDGVLGGPNLNEIEKMADGLKLDVIASGGVSELGDLKRISGLKRKNIIGAIIGKALYENKFNLKQAVDTCLQSA